MYKFKECLLRPESLAFVALTFFDKPVINEHEGL